MSIQVLLLSFLVPLLSHTSCDAKQKQYVVTEYGATGNGQTDDTDAIQACFKEALSGGGGTVIFPPGNYRISREISVNMSEIPLLEIEGMNKGDKRPVIFSDAFINIFHVLNYHWAPGGELRISNLELRGNNVPYSPSHPYYNKWSFRSGILVYNLDKVSIKDNLIRDFYGMGIQVAYTNPSTDPENRYDSVVISHNQILNCWGLQPDKNKNGIFDNYGDGIYLNSVKSALIAKNNIKNDLNETRQFGRGGIVIEYNAEDCTVSDNYIFGYDRNIHLEADLGGHVIVGNVLEGSDFGVLIYAFPRYRNKPVTITDNRISNKGLPRGLTLTRIRDSQERCLLSFYARDGCREGSAIIGNSFTIDPRFGYKYDSMIWLRERSLALKGNKFQVSGKRNEKKYRVRIPHPVTGMESNVIQSDISIQ